MKNILIAITLCFSITISSCSTGGGVDKEKIVSVANVALEYAVSQNKLSTEDAELIREALVIVSAGKVDKDSLVPAAQLALRVAEQRGAITPDKAAVIRLALALVG